MGDFVVFRGGEGERFRGAAVVFGLLWAAREGFGRDGVSISVAEG